MKQHFFFSGGRPILMGVPKYRTAFDNVVDVLNPELWARESLALLVEQMITASLVHRDFEDEIAEHGEVINVPIPGGFEAKRKHKLDDVTIQPAVADVIQVPLNQHFHVSFLIRDQEETVAFGSLVDRFLVPAIQAIARGVDRVVLGQYPQFLHNAVGELGNLNPENSVGYLLALRERMNINKVPMENRYLALGPKSETALLSNDMFLDASRIGDDGTALREASLGRKLGFNIYMALNAPSVEGGHTLTDGTVSATAAGQTVISTTGLGGPSVGAWLVIEGENYPHRIAEVDGDDITLETGLKKAVEDGAVVNVYTPGTVAHPNGGIYPQGWGKAIEIADFDVMPKIGQMVTFGTDLNSPKYSIIFVDEDSIVLDRPLEVQVAHGDEVNPGPAGEFNLAFVKDAIALVTRPLVTPKDKTGVIGSVQSFNDLSMRVVITYDGRAQGHLVTVDLLAGVKTLRPEFGAVLLA